MVMVNSKKTYRDAQRAMQKDKNIQFWYKLIIVYHGLPRN